MVAAPEYTLQTQSKIPLALAALHHLIHRVDPNDEADMDSDYEGGEAASAAAPINPEHLGSHLTSRERSGKHNEG
jgi:hypothetical protein